MDNDQPIDSDMRNITETNLGSVLFSDYGNESLIITSEIGNNLSSFEGALCCDETTNELVYINMIPQNIASMDSLANVNVFGNGVPSLSDLSIFNDGEQVMLLANGSIVIPNDDNLVSTSDPFILEQVLNADNFAERETKIVKSNKKTEYRVIPKIDAPMRILPKPNDKASKNIHVERIGKTLKARHQCKLCLAKFISLKEYKLHMLGHKDKIHKCKHCGASFNKLKNLILHEVIHNIGETTCPLTTCLKKFKRLASLKAHIKLHEEDESLTCPECGEEFGSAMNLELHYKYQPQCRLWNDDDPVPVTIKKIIQCKLCERDFENSNALITHKKEHEKLKKALATKGHRRKPPKPSIPASRINRCKMCPKWFLKPSQLIRHMRIHTGERPFECNVCNKAFNQANSLKIHMLKHTGDKPYLCPFCFIGFSQRGNLRQHITRVHSIPKVEESLYKCSNCSCSFKKVCSLNAHMNRVHRQRYYESHKSTITSRSPVVANVENSIMIENGLDDVDDEDMDELLNKETDVNTITIALDRGVHQKVFINKKGDTRCYRCSHCPKQSSKLKEIIRHLKINILGIYKCTHCMKTFSQQSTLLMHLALHATAQVYGCETCKVNFLNPLELKLHSNKCLDKSNVQLSHCVICTKSYPAAEIGTHICTPALHRVTDKADTTVDDANENTDKSNDAEKNKSGAKHGLYKVRNEVNLILPPYVCNRCNTTYESYAKLKQHLHEHGALLCEICCLEFPTKEKQEEHAVNHHVEAIKNLICGQCGKKFMTKRRRDLHSRSHSKRELACPRCSKRYKNDVMLEKHLKRVHNTEEAAAMVTEVKTNNEVPVSESSPSSSGVKCNVTADVNSSTDSERPARTSVNVCGVNLGSENREVNFANNIEQKFVANADNIKSLANESSLCDNRKASKSVNVVTNPTNDILLDTVNEITLGDKDLSTELLTIDDPLNDCYIDFQTNTAIPFESATLESSEPSASVANISGTVIHKCTNCSQQYYNEQDLEKHFQMSELCNNNNVSGIMNNCFYACNVCFLTFKTINSFLKHLTTHYDNKSYECLYCGVSNKTQADLTQHIAHHSLNKEYPCMHCGELFDSANAVKLHITDIHLMSSADNQFEATKRKKNTGNVLLSEKEKILLANQKPRKFSSISEKVLSSLLKNSVKNEIRRDTVESSCGEATTGKSQKPIMKKNANGNRNQKENACSYCGRAFKKMCDLIRHVRTHTGEKPYKCDYCSKCFTVKSILNCHLKTHFTVNNIFCHVCNRFFSTVGSLKIHMRLHTGDRPYQCLFCKETFRTSGHRDSHQKRHFVDKEKIGGGGVKTETICAEDVVVAAAATTTIETDANAVAAAAPLELNLSGVELPDAHFIWSGVTVPDNLKFQDIEFVDVNGSRITGSITCSICRRVFTDLDAHVSTHVPERSGDGVYACPICDSTYGQLDSFRTHLRRHICQRPYACERCGGTFASAKNLKVHGIRYHQETTLNLQIKGGGGGGDDDDDDEKPPDSNFEVPVSENKNEHESEKKNETVSDFYVIVNDMIQNFFPEDKRNENFV